MCDYTMRSTKCHLVSITLVSCVLSGLSDGFQLHLLCKTQNCIVTDGPTAYNYTCCVKQNCVVTDGPTAYNYTCVKHRIALSLVDQWLTITLVWNTELRCHWWTNGLQMLHGAMQHVLTHERWLVVCQGKRTRSSLTSRGHVIKMF